MSFDSHGLVCSIWCDWDRSGSRVPSLTKCWNGHSIRQSIVWNDETVGLHTPMSTSISMQWANVFSFSANKDKVWLQGQSSDTIDWPARFVSLYSSTGLLFYSIHLCACVMDTTMRKWTLFRRTHRLGAWKLRTSKVFGSTCPVSSGCVSFPSVVVHHETNGRGQKKLDPSGDRSTNFGVRKWEWLVVEGTWVDVFGRFILSCLVIWLCCCCLGRKLDAVLLLKLRFLIIV